MRFPKHCKSLLAATILTALSALAAPAMAQTWPAKPVRLIDPYAPGGSTSVVSRAISQKFQEALGQPMIVEYKPGAGSNIGSEAVAKAAPDGYTLLLGTSSLAINPHLYKSMGFDPLKDLAPIITLVRLPNVLAVHPSLPVKNVKELLDYARANPGKLNYGSSGNGATNHMGMEALKLATKTNLVHVPFKGGSEAMAALVAGQIQVLFNPGSTLFPQEKAGRLRIIAIGAPNKVDGIDLPPVSETVPGFDSGVWFAFFAPAGTPAAIVNRANAEFAKMARDPQVADALNRAGMTFVGGPPEALGKMMAEETARWGAVIKASGIKIE